MRVSAAGFAANSIEEAKKLSRLVTEVSHNHPEGIKGAEATVVAIFMAKTGSNIFEIRDYIDRPSSSLLDLKMQLEMQYLLVETVIRLQLSVVELQKHIMVFQQI